MKSAPTPKVRPIVLTASEVRAVLNGSKTQHRIKVTVPRYMRDRIVCFDKAWADRGFGGYGYLKLPNRHGDDPEDPVEQWAVTRICCPLVDNVGDQLWVRETFGFNHYDDGNTRSWKRTIYRADGVEAPSDNGSPAPWRPPLAMPRRLSRITLTVESVRAQRVQDISEEEARADGVDEFPICIQDQHGRVKPAVYHRLAESCRDAYQRKHISRYGIDSWRANDWVFALTFKPLLPEVTP